MQSTKMVFKSHFKIFGKCQQNFHETSKKFVKFPFFLPYQSYKESWLFPRRFLFTSYPRMISFGISFAWWGALSPVVLSFGSICPHWEEKSYPKLRAPPLYSTLLTSLGKSHINFRKQNNEREKITAELAELRLAETGHFRHPQ